MHEVGVRRGLCRESEPLNQHVQRVPTLPAPSTPQPLPELQLLWLQEQGAGTQTSRTS